MLKYFKYKCVNSTNHTAINIIKQKNITSGLVIAEKQKKGKGQRGKKWISHKGNLFVTIFFSLEKIKLSLEQLTVINSKLIIKLLSFYYKKKINVKLPNDILINKKKICGILQETIQNKGINYLIVGIGLNLIKHPNIENYPTTDLYDLTKNKISVNRISKKLKYIYINFLKSQKAF